MRVFFKIVYVLFAIGFAHTAFSLAFDEKKGEGNELYKAGDFEGAVNHYEAALAVAQTSQDFAIGHSNLGQCYRRQHDVATALSHYDNALYHDPTHHKALYWAIALRFTSARLVREQCEMIESMLLRAHDTYPQEKLFRTLHAQFGMIKESGHAAPGVSYIPAILDPQDFSKLEGIFKRATWGKIKEGSATNCRLTGNDKMAFVEVLGSITDRLQERNMLPKGVKQFGYTMVSYPENGFLRQHKDHKKRVDHFVLGISLGGPCHLDFVIDNTDEKTSLCLASNSAFVMEGAAHDKCTHGISHVSQERFSLLFYVPAAEDQATEKFDIETKKLVSPPEGELPHMCPCQFHRMMQIMLIMQMFSAQ